MRFFPTSALRCNNMRKPNWNHLLDAAPKKMPAPTRNPKTQKRGFNGMSSNTGALLTSHGVTRFCFSEAGEL